MQEGLFGYTATAAQQAASAAAQHAAQHAAAAAQQAAQHAAAAAAQFTQVHLVVLTCSIIANKTDASYIFLSFTVVKNSCVNKHAWYEKTEVEGELRRLSFIEIKLTGSIICLITYRNF